MRKLLFLLTFLGSVAAHAQVKVDLSKYTKSSTTVTQQGSDVVLTWPAAGKEMGKLVVSLAPDKALFSHIQLSKDGKFSEIATDMNPAFVLTIGKRDLVHKTAGTYFLIKPTSCLANPTPFN